MLDCGLGYLSVDHPIGVIVVEICGHYRQRDYRPKRKQSGPTRQLKETKKGFLQNDMKVKSLKSSPGRLTLQSLPAPALIPT